MNKENRSIGKNIRLCRKSAKMTQEEAAKALNVGQNTWSMWESGQRKITLEQASQIATLFGVKVDDLLP